MVYTSQRTPFDLFANAFPLNGKISLSVAGVSENGRKKWFPLARKSVSTSRNYFSNYFLRLFFKNCVSASTKRSPNKTILFQVDRKSISTSRNGEFV